MVVYILELQNSRRIRKYIL